MTVTVSVDADAEVLAWIGGRAVPLRARGSSTIDGNLDFLRRALGGVRVIGLGEATHGTREFFSIRQKLLEFLVVEMGFNTLAIEGSHSAAERVDDFVRNGVGDRAAVLSGLGSVMWDIEEFAQTLEWLRAYNSSVPHERKVRFFGVDLYFTRHGRDYVLRYLRQMSSEWAASAESVFHTIGAAEARGLLLAHEGLDATVLERLSDLQTAMIGHQSEWTARSSAAELANALRHVGVIRQWVQAYEASGLNIYARSRYMADILLGLIVERAPDSKVVLWAHNFHIGVGFEDPGRGPMPNMGQRLRERLGERYYACGFELDQGEYLSRAWAVRGRTLGELKKVAVAPAPSPEGSLPWWLSRVDEPAFMLNLRGPAQTPAVHEWLQAPRMMHCLGWSHNEPPTTTTVTVGKHFDGLVFVRHTSATTPTVNALDIVSRRAGH